jgi:hypothetical protein
MVRATTMSPVAPATTSIIVGPGKRVDSKPSVVTEEPLSRRASGAEMLSNGASSSAKPRTKAASMAIRVETTTTGPRKPRKRSARS